MPYEEEGGNNARVRARIGRVRALDSRFSTSARSAALCFSCAPPALRAAASFFLHASPSLVYLPHGGRALAR